MKLSLVLLTLLSVKEHFGKPLTALGNNNIVSTFGSIPRRQQLRPATYNDFMLQETYAYPGLDGQTNIILIYSADELELEQIIQHFKLQAEKDAATTPAPGPPPSGLGGAVTEQSISGAAIGSLLGIGAG